jgi:hypothetical protein
LVDGGPESVTVLARVGEQKKAKDFSILMFSLRLETKIGFWMQTHVVN